jgi:D-beta-D-heptose 7-phosphate kinase/D-beta-D-heptose 1-phosphate adenosyltransferase
MNKILVIGDIIIDEFIYGEVNRMSPEAPVPILEQKDKKTNAGGAANVVRNLLDLGNEVIFVSATGMDKRIFNLLPFNSSEIFVTPDIETITKTRFVNQDKHLLRVDEETIKSVPLYIEDTLFALVERNIKYINLLIISDYNKGLLSNKLIKLIINNTFEYIFIGTLNNNLQTVNNLDLINGLLSSKV